jgi:diguanylate cyclase (GGDEF)-like protein
VHQHRPRVVRAFHAIRRRPRTAAFAVAALLFAAAAGVGAFPQPPISNAGSVEGGAFVALLPGGRTWLALMQRLGRPLARAGRRLRRDHHALLAIALVIPVLIVDVVVHPASLPATIPVSLLFLGLQAGLGLSKWVVQHRGLGLFRLLIALAYVAIAGRLSGEVGTPPLAALQLPIIALAAMVGGREALVVGLAGCSGYLLPMFLEGSIAPFARERGIVLAASAIVLAIGTRRTVVSLERALERLRRAHRADRRRAEQMSAVEAVGRLLAEQGASGAALEGVMDVLVERFDYRFVSIYLGDGRRVQLGAQRGYHSPIAEIESTRGVVGRVMRTGQPAFLADITSDPDYVAADDDIASEVSVPLVMHGEPFGVLSVEGTRANPVDRGDLATMVLVADRLASALALAREREAMSRRATMFEGLTKFETRMAASLAPVDLHDLLARSVSEVISCDAVTLTLLDPASGDYRIAAAPGSDEGMVGQIIKPGLGLTGRAIAERRLVVDGNHHRDRWPPALRHADIPDVILIAAAPLIRDEVVVGALALMRFDLDHHLDDLELEVLRILAGQAALAITNANLHAAVLMAAARERDALTVRAARFEGLTEFATLMTGTLAPSELHQLIVRSVDRVVPCDSVILTVLDGSTAEYRICASTGSGRRVDGARVLPGEGLIGRAIADRQMVVDLDSQRGDWPIALRDIPGAASLMVAAAPMIRDGAVVGAIGISRQGDAVPFDDLELEVLPLIASQAALAITNASLHEAAMEASVRDSLTGLFNRRHLDASLARLFAARDRTPIGERRAISVILFDLDHFGAFNKQHGHQLGDEVLRSFGRVLRERSRSSDIVARFGGEEFLVVLDGAGRDEAVRIANEVRTSFAALRFVAPDGETLTATVSAGCAGLGDGSVTAETLLSIADVGLAMAKQAGRNRVVAA